jgi:hypothetical protein
MNSPESKMEHTRAALQLVLGGTAFAAGADKFTNWLADWDQYLSPEVQRRLPVSGRNFMRAVGMVEMAVGALVLKGHTRAGGFLMGGWLLAIAANLISSGKFLDVAVRDINIAVAAFAMAGVTEARRELSHGGALSKRAA